MNREQLLAHLIDDEERLLGAKIIDRISKALNEGGPTVTPFLDPSQREIAQGIIGSIETVRTRSYGGHKDAERQRLVIYPEYYLPELIEIPIRAIEITGAFDEPPGHRDVLGSIMSLGIEREQVGDILPTQTGCQVIVPEELIEFYLTNLARVGRTSVTAEEIDFERLNIEPERVREVRTTVASLRLDALAAAGFGTSRSKMAREIKMDRVKVNWKAVTNPAAEVKDGDILSIRGRGRVHVESVDGTTRKGRIHVQLVRYQ